MVVIKKMLGDQLQPSPAVELLKLFQDCDWCVFILAVDDDVVSQSIRQQYGEALGMDKGRSFLIRSSRRPSRCLWPTTMWTNMVKVMEAPGLEPGSLELYVRLAHCAQQPEG